MKIFDWWYYFKEKYKYISIQDPTTTKVITTQENPRDAESIKRFNESFNFQEQQMQIRSCVGHERDCPMINCGGCFKWEPDKIISQEIVSDDSVRKDMKRRVLRNKSDSKLA